MPSDQLAELRKPVRVGDWEIPYRPHGKSRKLKSGGRIFYSHLGDAGGFRWSVRTERQPGREPWRFVVGWVKLPCAECGRQWRAVIIGSMGEFAPETDFRQNVAAYLQGGCGACGTTKHDKRDCPHTKSGRAFNRENRPECRNCGHYSDETGVPWKEEDDA